MGTTFRQRRWTRKEYDQAVQVGIFHEDEKLELLAGRLVVAEPQNAPHAAAIQLVAETLRIAFGPGWSVRVQLPLALDPDSEPEPDVAVVPGQPRDYLVDHPSSPALVVEVADASLRLDRRIKAAIYARGGITDYWIVNIADEVVEVHRQPEQRGHRWRYRSVERLGTDAALSPLVIPDVRIAVVDLLP